MAGRGRGRGRSRGILDSDFTSPGGLTSKNVEEEQSTSADHSDEESAKTSDGRGDGGETLSPPNNTAGVATGRPTLSLDDMKSILENSRTYSEQSDVKRVLLCAKNCVRTEEDVKTLASLIYNKCLEDSSLAKRGSEICDSLTSIEIGNVKFRNSLLALVQADYKNRSELIADNPARFNGFLAFLCEMFGIMRTVSNEVFKPLVTPIYDCFNLVLGPEEGGEEDDSKGGGDAFSVDEDACENFSIQLQAIGRLLEENSDDQMSKLVDRIRTCIIHSKSSPRVRCCLLEVVEAYARGWETASNETTRFYCDTAVGIISGLFI